MKSVSLNATIMAAFACATMCASAAISFNPDNSGATSQSDLQVNSSIVMSGDHGVGFAISDFVPSDHGMADRDYYIAQRVAVPEPRSMIFGALLLLCTAAWRISRRSRLEAIS